MTSWVDPPHLQGTDGDPDDRVHAFVCEIKVNFLRLVLRYQALWDTNLRAAVVATLVIAAVGVGLAFALQSLLVKLGIAGAVWGVVKRIVNRFGQS